VLAEPLEEKSRKLILENESSDLRFILAKPVDVPTYVEYGSADLGIVGKDVLVEAGSDICELLDLGLGFCRMIVAVPKDGPIKQLRQLGFDSRVATKYPNLAQEFFNRQGLKVEVIKLNGSIELGPIVGLADAIVDITSSGQTLAENGLVPIATLGAATARLIANPISYKMHFSRIIEVVRRLEPIVLKGEERDDPDLADLGR
jgi:ATP phosphoribosyltransferase